MAQTGGHSYGGGKIIYSIYFYLLLKAVPSAPLTIPALRDYGLRLAEISAATGVPSLVALTANLG